MKIILLALTLLLAGLALAENPNPAPVERPLTPMMQEIQDLQDTAHAAVAELAGQLTGMRDQDQIMAVQREIARIKTESRVEVMRIQLKYAVAEGRQDDAAKLEEIITRLTAPRTPVTPVHPAPTRDKK